MWFGVSLIGIVEHLAQEGGKEQAIEYFTREYVNILYDTTVLTGAPGLVSTIPWPRYRSLTSLSWMESPVSVSVSNLILSGVVTPLLILALSKQICIGRRIVCSLPAIACLTWTSLSGFSTVFIVPATRAPNY